MLFSTRHCYCCCCESALILVCRHGCAFWRSSLLPWTVHLGSWFLPAGTALSRLGSTLFNLLCLSEALLHGEQRVHTMSILWFFLFIWDLLLEVIVAHKSRNHLQCWHVQLPWYISKVSLPSTWDPGQDLCPELLEIPTVEISDHRNVFRRKEDEI